jgi:hypothetical protein
VRSPVNGRTGIRLDVTAAKMVRFKNWLPRQQRPFVGCVEKAEAGS